MNIYYILYKNPNSPFLWIVDESIDKNELLDRLYDSYPFDNKEEIYYLIGRKYHVNIKPFKRFDFFKQSNNDQIYFTSN